MKIAIIIGNLAIGGAERLALDEVNELFRRGIPVILITLKNERENSYMRACMLPESERICICFGSLFDIMAWMRLIRTLRKQRVDALLTHLWYSNTIGRVAARVAGIRIVLSFEHNIYDSVKTTKQFLVDRILQRLSRRVVAVSGAVRGSLISHGIEPARVIVIENGIDLSRYRDAPVAGIRREKGLDDGTVFLFVGRLIPQKGLDILIEALARVPAASLLIAGEGGERAMLEAKARELGVSSRVFFLGVRDDIPALMKASECLVLPSRYEGQGLVILEAMAAGIPSVITDFPAGAGIVRDGKNGLIVPREDPLALAKAMERMQDKEFRSSLARSAAGQAVTFSISKHVDSILCSLK